MGALVDAVDVSTRSIRDPAQGVYEYLEERHEERGVRVGCYLFPVQLAGWMWRREGRWSGKYKRRFCTFDAASNELSVFKDDDTSATSGHRLCCIVLTRVTMSPPRESDPSRRSDHFEITGYARDAELHKHWSDHISQRRSSISRWLPGEHQRFYRPHYEQLQAVSKKASIVWAHCFRHQMKNQRRRKRIVRQRASVRALDRLDGSSPSRSSYCDQDDSDDDDEDDDDLDDGDVVYDAGHGGPRKRDLYDFEGDDDLEPEFVFDERQMLHAPTPSAPASVSGSVSTSVSGVASSVASSSTPPSPSSALDGSVNKKVHHRYDRHHEQDQVVQLKFDDESEVPISTSCRFSSLGVQVANSTPSVAPSEPLPPSRPSPSTQQQPLSPPLSQLQQQQQQQQHHHHHYHQQHPLPPRSSQIPPSLAKWNGVSSTASIASSAPGASIWGDDDLLSFRVDFDAVERTRCLTSGASGEIWLALYRSQRIVAKSLKPAVAGDLAASNGPRRRQRIDAFVHEIRVLSQLRHDRVVAFLGLAWTMEHDMQLLMEYAPKGDLRTYLAYLKRKRKEKIAREKGKLSLSSGARIRTEALLVSEHARRSEREVRDRELAEAMGKRWKYQQWRIAVDIIEGLVYLHSLRPVLVHCDIKPRNLLLDDRMRVKLADFGIARYMDSTTLLASDHDHEGSDSGHRGDGTGARSESFVSPAIQGTGRWMAPEILAGGQAYTPAVDIYAFGIVLSEIDTFELPFHERRMIVSSRGGSSRRMRRTSTHAMDEGGGENDDEVAMSEDVLLHHIVVDEWMPSFSATCPDAVLQLAHECMAAHPQRRPTSLDVAHRLRMAMRQCALSP